VTLLRRIDAAIYVAEGYVVGWMLAGMSVVVFVDVVHRIFSRSPGRLAIILGGLTGQPAATIDLWVAPAIILATLFALSYGAIKTRARTRDLQLGRGPLALRAFGVTAGLTLVMQTFLWLRPEGVVWAPYGALVTLLWVGLIGASMATYKGRHLALEMGEKLWPEAARPWVRRLAGLVTSAFALLIVVLGSISLADHFASWARDPSADLIPAVDWPKWLVFVVVPYAFGMIALRTLGRALGVLPPAEQPEVPS
jgi:TRAP-type C4-dicarboxylate transport system permease small subunit